MSISKSEQARVNGAKSNGPKTPQGKPCSSRNALKHDRYATNAIAFKDEDHIAFEALVAVFVRRIQPTDQVEYRLTRELASIEWRRTRIFALDARMFDHEQHVQAPALHSAELAAPEPTRLLLASRFTVGRSQYHAYLGRRESELNRARLSVLSVLKDLRKISHPPNSPSKSFPLKHLPPNRPLGTNPNRTKTLSMIA